MPCVDQLCQGIPSEFEPEVSTEGLRQRKPDRGWQGKTSARFEVAQTLAADSDALSQCLLG